MKKTQALKKVIAAEVKSILKEDPARGISDFALAQVALETKESMRRVLLLHINMRSQDPSNRRALLVAANDVLKEIEKDVKALLEDKLLDFMRVT